ncbi:Leishmanolysin-like peptidase [Trichoplax sp. H2]|nr:Leishmanolysin-like peptidase [Trichoplax sp. H2]|eukprot:RDD40189.1 Leishmanolysin-like peptidase [Trichoplax sp. H2]
MSVYLLSILVCDRPSFRLPTIIIAICYLAVLMVAAPATYAASYDEYLHPNGQVNHKAKSKTFLPLRIYPYYIEEHIHLPPAYNQALRQWIIPQAIHKISSILSSTLPLRYLKLQSCLVRHQIGKNKGKCAMIDPLPCGTFAKFTIPADHTDLTEICPDSDDITTCFTMGTHHHGLANTDYIWYIFAKEVEACKYAAAFASTCVESDDGRPLAGYVNFCHKTFETVNKFSMLNVAVHELLHALGFSDRYMRRFKDINGKSFNAIRTFYRRGEKIQKLISPRVVKMARVHFNCSALDGVELENDGMHQGSHWEMRILHGDIMTAAPPSEVGSAVAISTITLAAMEDSGFYFANYSAADQFLYGKDRGCQFIASSCSATQSTYPYSCQPNKLKYGCSPDMKSTGICTKNAYLDGCHIYKSVKSCQYSKSSKGSCGQSYSPNSQCFINTLSPIAAFQTAPMGGCFYYNCIKDNVTNRLAISLNYSGSVLWCLKEKQHIRISGYGCYGYLICPSLRHACVGRIKTGMIPSDALQFESGNPTSIIARHTQIIFLIATVTASIMANLMVLFVLMYQIKTITNILMINFIIGNCLIAALIIPFQISVLIHQKWIFGPVWCNIHAFITGIVISCQPINLTIISLTRFYSLRQNISSDSIYSNRVAILLLIIIWSISTVIPFTPVIGLSIYVYDFAIKDCIHDWRLDSGLSFAFLFNFCICCIASSIIYIIINHRYKHGTYDQLQIIITKAHVAVFCTTCLYSSPYYIVVFLGIFLASISDTAYYLSLLGLFLNCVISPIMYAIFIGMLEVPFLKILLSIWQRHDKIQKSL